MSSFTMDINDKKVEIDVAPEIVLDLIEKYKKKASKSNVTTKVYEYSGLVNITEENNGRVIAFNFSKNILRFDFAKCKFVNPDGTYLNTKTWTELNKFYGRINMERHTEVKWIKCFFELLNACLQNNRNVLNGHSNKTQHLEKYPEIIASAESFAKVDWVQDLIQEDVSVVLKLSKCGTILFKDLKGNRKWFVEHKDEQVDMSRRDRYDHTRTNIKKATLNGWANYYYNAIDKGVEDAFIYMWENYKLPMTEAENFNEIINKYGCEYKAAVNYVVTALAKQGLIYSGNEYREQMVTTWCDYLKMSTDIGGRYEKYPKYLSTMHDIAVSNYKLNQDSIMLKKYEQVHKQNKVLEYKNEKYSIVIPANIKDIVAEGNSLGHCVASYVDKVVDGRTIIAFLRDNKDLATSLVTVEISTNYDIVQKGGKSNRAPSEDEAAFLKLYQDKHLSKLKKGKPATVSA